MEKERDVLWFERDFSVGQSGSRLGYLKVPVTIYPLAAREVQNNRMTATRRSEEV